MFREFDRLREYVVKRFLLVAVLLLVGCQDALVESPYVMLTNIEGSGGGTGFYVKAASGKTVIVTNRHICDGAAIYQYKFGRPIELQIIEVAPHTDLCLLQPVAHYAKPLRLAASEPQPHEKVHVIGFGLLLGESRTDGYWVGRLFGVLLGVENPAYATVPILPGNSGSPIMNAQDEVVGVVFASSSEIDNRSIIVNLDQLRQFLAAY
jgi:serine protease Do